jgi:hypothetical protein
MVSTSIASLLFGNLHIIKVILDVMGRSSRGYFLIQENHKVNRYVNILSIHPFCSLWYPIFHRGDGVSIHIEN